MEIEQEEMQFLGFIGIYKESYKLIFKWRKIFSQITLTLILPLTIIFLAHVRISQILQWRLWRHEFILHGTQSGTPSYNNLSHLVSSEWLEYLLFKAIYFTFVLVYSLLCTSAVVYTIASAYTSREITFKKVMSVVPRVWKRLMVTFLCAFFAFCAYNMVLALTIYVWGATLADYSTLGDVVLVVILVLYATGFVYLTIIWQLASVVSVLEDSYGVKAMMKSKGLIKGKMGLSIAIFLMLNLSFAAMYFGFRVYMLLIRVHSLGVLGVLGFGGLVLLVFLKMILFGLVVQTVIYFVCKSYHHENIDKSALSDHLEVYLGEYVPLKAKDVQMEEYDHDHV